MEEQVRGNLRVCKCCWTRSVLRVLKPGVSRHGTFASRLSLVLPRLGLGFLVIFVLIVTLDIDNPVADSFLVAGANGTHAFPDSLQQNQRGPGGHEQWSRRTETYSQECQNTNEDERPADVLKPVSPPPSSSDAAPNPYVVPIPRIQAHKRLDKADNAQGEDALREVVNPCPGVLVGNPVAKLLELVYTSCDGVQDCCHRVAAKVDDGIGDEAQGKNSQDKDNCCKERAKYFTTDPSRPSQAFQLVFVPAGRALPEVAVGG